LKILVEALACGLSRDKAIELAAEWNICGGTVLELAKAPLGIHIREDGNRWCASSYGAENIQEDPSGFGVTPLEALTSLYIDTGRLPDSRHEK
jgi:hypothetical protein